MDTDTLTQAYKELEEALGGVELARSMARTLDNNTLEDILAYIARMEDIKRSVELSEKE